MFKRSFGKSVLADLPSEIICQKLCSVVASCGNSKAMPTMAIGSSSCPSAPWPFNGMLAMTDDKLFLGCTIGDLFSEFASGFGIRGGRILENLFVLICVASEAMTGSTSMRQAI